MNKANILAVADAIEQHSIPDLGFNMSYWTADADEETPDRSGHGCGTIACIAGWAARVALGRPLTEFGDRILDEAVSFLDLGRDQSNGLFMPIAGPVGMGDWNSVTPSHAVAVLRHLAETGEVDWSIGAPEASK